MPDFDSPEFQALPLIQQITHLATAERQLENEKAQLEAQLQTIRQQKRQTYEKLLK